MTTPKVSILEGHTDEVWAIQFSHDGAYLASASKDRSVIIWRLESDSTSTLNLSPPRAWRPHLTLQDHPYAVCCLAWSLDDLVLLTGSENFIQLWDTNTGICTDTLNQHTETITALAWLPDGSGFVSGGLDGRILVWNTDGTLRDTIGTKTTLVTSLTLNEKRLVVVGMHRVSEIRPPSFPSVAGETDVDVRVDGLRKCDNAMDIYDLETKLLELSIPFEGPLNSVEASRNSQYILINHAPRETLLFDLTIGRAIHIYTGHLQGPHVIRSSLGGANEDGFVASGSEDGNVYLWNRDTEALVDVLPGHGRGSVNAVAWHPKKKGLLASCSDDCTIRIWEWFDWCG